MTRFLPAPVLGRGNQQLTSAVLRHLGPGLILIVAALERLASLQGRPLLINIDDPDLAAALAGMRRILTGPGRLAVYPVAVPGIGPGELRPEDASRCPAR